MTIKTRAQAKSTIKTVAVSVAKGKPVARKVTKTEQAEIVDNTPANEPTQSVEMSGADKPITGRGVFAVRTLGEAVSVEAAFLAEDGNVLRLPAVFPNREYALQQIDELRDIVARHFNEISNLNSN